MLLVDQNANKQTFFQMCYQLHCLFTILSPEYLSPNDPSSLFRLRVCNLQLSVGAAFLVGTQTVAVLVYPHALNSYVCEKSDGEPDMFMH